MPAKFQDYYHSLGVSRTASPDEIQAAYRKLARQYHPDVSKEAGADARFKEIGEAYEVLKDPEKRKRYDALGANWKQGQEFRPPPGWGGGGGGGNGARRGRTQVSGDFSDFFESIFGGAGAGGFGGGDPFAEAMRGGGGGGRARGGRPHVRAGQTHEVEITIPLIDAFRGAMRRIALSSVDEDGQEETKNYEVKIPAGVTDGSTIRLPGQGGEGFGGGARGDLLLKVNIAPDSRFRIDPHHKHDLTVTLPIAPWEAVLGAKIPVQTLDDEVVITLPPGSQSGQRLRIKGRGLPKKGGESGDLFAELKIVVPKSPTEAERGLYQRLADESNFDPRGS